MKYKVLKKFTYADGLKLVKVEKDQIAEFNDKNAKLFTRNKWIEKIVEIESAPFPDVPTLTGLSIIGEEAITVDPLVGEIELPFEAVPSVGEEPIVEIAPKRTRKKRASENQ
jgi:hypothetical protein